MTKRFTHRPAALLAIALAAALSPLAIASPVAADPPIVQNASLRQIRHFTGHYARALPGADDPSYPLTANTVLRRATGRIRGTVSTYKLHEGSRKWDFYFVDLDVDVDRRRGDEDWGWMRAWLSSTGSVRTYYPRWSRGLSAVGDDSCRPYSITLNASFAGLISASAPIASFDTCAKGASISSWSQHRGRGYQLNRVNGARHATFRRFVQVRAGKLPKFRVQVSWNKDSGRTHCGTYSTGSGTVYDCWPDRGSGGYSVTVGTHH